MIWKGSPKENIDWSINDKLDLVGPKEPDAQTQTLWPRWIPWTMIYHKYNGNKVEVVHNKLSVRSTKYMSVKEETWIYIVLRSSSNSMKSKDLHSLAIKVMSPV